MSGMHPLSYLKSAWRPITDPAVAKQQAGWGVVICIILSLYIGLNASKSLNEGIVYAGSLVAALVFAALALGIHKASQPAAWTSLLLYILLAALKHDLRAFVIHVLVVAGLLQSLRGVRALRRAPASTLPRSTSAP